MSHFLTIESERTGEPCLEIECSEPPDAPCRRRPLDKAMESWTDDDALDGGGHECWAVEWVQEAGFDDAVVIKPLGEPFAKMPIKITYDEGVVITKEAAE